MKRIVVVGGSLAGHHAAGTLRRLGYDGALTVIGSEQHRPYDRYPLSKAFLTGETDWQGLELSDDVPDVAWRLGSAATGVDLGARHVVVDDRERVPFDGLVVASGARPRHAELTREQDGAFVLRTVEDAVDLRAALASPGRRVVVVGGGLIGAEIAATAVEAGHHATLVHTGDVPTLHGLGPLVAEYVRGLHGAAGVRLRPRARVRELVGKPGILTAVVLEDGSRIAADVVVMATGTEANVGWLRRSGLATSGGLHCGPTLFAVGSDRVVAAGDVVRAPHPLIGEAVRMAHWASTRHQAELAVENLLVGPGEARPLTALPEFGTRIHGARIRGVGFPQIADRDGVVWGSLRQGSAVIALARGGRSVALVSVNADRVLNQLAGQLWPDYVAGPVPATEPLAS
jgi:NADPH-dependent 2,4-dienoyl-CoA reductase/sulfur reductase-like enzyme